MTNNAWRQRPIATDHPSDSGDLKMPVKHFSPLRPENRWVIHHLRTPFNMKFHIHCNCQRYWLDNILSTSCHEQNSTSLIFKENITHLLGKARSCSLVARSGLMVLGLNSMAGFSFRALGMYCILSVINSRSFLTQFCLVSRSLALRMIL